MSELSKRSAKYYFIGGLKQVGIMILLQVALVVEWVVLGYDDHENIMDFVIEMLITAGAYFTIFINLLYAMYGPNWYDSMVLSMGARRKDVFWGEMIKQITFVVGNSLVYMLVVAISKEHSYMYFILCSAVIGIAVGPLGLVIGHTMKKFGKLAVIIVALISGCFGAFLIFSVEDSKFAIKFPHIGFALVLLVGIVVFVASEAWVYKLNKKSMVI